MEKRYSIYLTKEDFIDGVTRCYADMYEASRESFKDQISTGASAKVIEHLPGHCAICSQSGRCPYEKEQSAPPTPAPRDVQVLEREVYQWKRVAAYMADCHASTLSGEGMTKSCSKGARKRYLTVCRRAIAMLANREIPPHWGLPVGDVIRSSIEHCERAIGDVEFKFGKQGD